MFYSLYTSPFTVIVNLLLLSKIYGRTLPYHLFLCWLVFNDILLTKPCVHLTLIFDGNHQSCCFFLRIIWSNIFSVTYALSFSLNVGIIPALVVYVVGNMKNNSQCTSVHLNWLTRFLKCSTLEEGPTITTWSSRS